MSFHLRLYAKILCIFVCSFILADSSFTDNDKLVVKTKWGFVRGKWSKTTRDRLVKNFLGIPYALPPVGELRFRNPQRWNRPWTTIRNVTTDASACLHFKNKYSTLIGSEDCLYLNVFVPQIVGENKIPKKLPVLTFVHGGAFIKGSSNSELFAPDYLLNQDVILVTMNYRLAVLGFFSTSNRASPGNYAIKDVKMALEWIQENIDNFGGDPKSVTLVGHSAGSVMTHILSLSPKTKELVHKYILLSGSASSPWSVRPRRRYRQVCMKLAKLVGCQLKNVSINETVTENSKDVEIRDVSYPGKIKDDEEVMKCMRKVDARKIQEMMKYFHVWKQNPLTIFGPTLEDESNDAILTMHPLKMIKDGLFRDIPAIFQVVEDEGLTKTLDMIVDPSVENELIENFEEYFPYILEYHDVISNKSAFMSAIEQFYFKGGILKGITHNITKVVGDGTFIWPMFQALQYQSQIGNSSIYFSFFTYYGTFTETFKYGQQVYFGVDHGDDMNYLFPYLNNKYPNMLLHNTENDITMINIMTEMWASFATTGIPKAWVIPAWPSYRDHHEFMRFGIGKSADAVVQTDFLPDRMGFWQKLNPLDDELAESPSDVFVNEPEEEDASASSAIDRRLSMQFVSLVVICFYM